MTQLPLPDCRGPQFNVAQALGNAGVQTESYQLTRLETTYLKVCTIVITGFLGLSFVVSELEKYAPSSQAGQQSGSDVAISTSDIRSQPFDAQPKNSQSHDIQTNSGETATVFQYYEQSELSSDEKSTQLVPRGDGTFLIVDSNLEKRKDSLGYGVRFDFAGNSDYFKNKFREPEQIKWMPQAVNRWWPQILEVSKQQAVDPQLIAMLMLLESGGKVDAESNAGAYGMLQLMPATAEEVAKQNGLPNFQLRDLQDPHTNLSLGSIYFRQNFNNLRGQTGPNGETDLELAVGSYNGGLQGMTDYINRIHPLKKETITYMTRFRGLWNERNLPESKTFSQWYHGQKSTSQLNSHFDHAVAKMMGLKMNSFKAEIVVATENS